MNVIYPIIPPKNSNAKKTISKSKNYKEDYMKPDHIKNIIWKSVESGKGGRKKNLRVYVRFFNSNHSEFLKDKRERIKNGGKNEFKSEIDGFDSGIP